LGAHRAHSACTLVMRAAQIFDDLAEWILPKDLLRQP
jgi:hypothetical protein